MMLFVCIAFILLYALFISSSIRGWKRLKSIRNKNGVELKFSIIIPCKNEQENISSIFVDLEEQLYPKDRFEIIFIDDHSTDSTAEKIIEHQNKSGLKSILLHLDNRKGKKAAIEEGIEKSNHDYIITTDADCRFPVNWIGKFAENFSVTKADFLSAPVYIKPDRTFFSQLQCFEFSVLSGITAAFFGLRRPIMCNGANLGYKKELYTELGGYREHVHLLSGDDIFLMHGAKKIPDKKLEFIFDKDAMVETGSKISLRAFIQQRLRWAGKSTSYKDKDTIAVGALIFSYNLLLLVSFVIGIFIPELLIPFIALLLSKLLLDIYFVQEIKHFFKLKDIFFNSIILTLLYPFYTVGIGVISLFAPVKWKN